MEIRDRRGSGRGHRLPAVPLNKTPGLFRATIENWGECLAAAGRELESCTFFNREDGRLSIGSWPNAPLKEVEIAYFDLGNSDSLHMLPELNTEKRRGTAEFFLKSKKEFRLSGYEKGKPTLGHILCFDQNGLYVYDLRQSFETAKVLTAH